MTINCKGELLSLHTPRVMGILNHTPDSFYAGSRVTENNALARAEEMLLQGADFIDVGGYSTRPNAAEVSEEEELKRVVPLVRSLVQHFPQVRISVDTFRAEVAKQALSEGAAIVNDISAGLLDEQMLPLVAQWQVPYIAMHMVGTPQTKQQHTSYKNIITDMLYYFSERKAKALQWGINDFIVDVGFGFSKTLEQNYQVLKQLETFHSLECPLLVGVSRKSMLYKLLDTTPAEALNATTSVHTIALMKGAHILRAHDVKEAKECVAIINALRL